MPVAEKRKEPAHFLMLLNKTYNLYPQTYKILCVSD
jgi:hypothetical protein